MIYTGQPVPAFDTASNDGASEIAQGLPYVATVTIEGVAAILLHRWVVDKPENPGPKAKGTRKTDNLETYVYRTADGMIGVPGEYLRMCVVGAARYLQDPRSPRKCAMDLYKAGIVALTDIASFGVKDWNFVDRRRVTIQRSGITRERPALRPGWRCTVQFLVQTPEYIEPRALHAALNSGGRLIGVGDFRPTFGRFQVVAFTVGLE